MVGKQARSDDPTSNKDAMTQTAPIITFRVAVPSTASPEAIYDVLSDPNTHLLWAGEQAPVKGFRLVAMEAPTGSATVGTEFSSKGVNSGNGKWMFSDRSVVIEAERGKRFGFDTDAGLTRPRAGIWRARFAHRYTIVETGEGATIRYTCEVRPQNYVPPWLKPWSRPLTRMMVQSRHRKHMQNLARMAESTVRT